MRNAAEIEAVLVNLYGTKEAIPPIVLIYTDGGPEHRSNYLSVKLALIALQKNLNADTVCAVRTALDHSYRNPVEKINCLLNIALYGVGMMRQTVHKDPRFEKKIANCSNVGDV